MTRTRFRGRGWLKWGGKIDDQFRPAVTPPSSGRTTPFPEIPPRVEYHSTPFGLRILGVVENIEDLQGRLEVEFAQSGEAAGSDDAEDDEGRGGDHHGGDRFVEK